ncbi:MAG: hypothetical protein Q8L76_08180, partial [Cypionkella sp.]|nr:hypothetical protein [Cypionkella sp.]
EISVTRKPNEAKHRQKHQNLDQTPHARFAFTAAAGLPRAIVVVLRCIAAQCILYMASAPSSRHLGNKDLTWAAMRHLRAVNQARQG